LLRSSKGKSDYIPSAIPWPSFLLCRLNSVTAAKCNWQDTLAALPKGLSALQSYISIAGGAVEPNWFCTAYEYIWTG